MLKATVVFLVYLIKTVSLAFFSYLFIYFWKYHLLNAPLKKKKNLFWLIKNLYVNNCENIVAICYDNILFF